MEHLSGPEKPSPESIQPTYVRPPGLEFAMGVALFGVLVVTYALLQEACIIAYSFAHSPELIGQRFHLGQLSDPHFTELMIAMRSNGDAIARTATIGPVFGIIALLSVVKWWKKKHFSNFLGFHVPLLRDLVKWGLIFAVLVASIELLATLFPVFRTDFMEKILASNTERLWLIMGVGLLTPLFEELLLRGLLQGSLRHIADEHSAIAITAGVFAVMHLQYDLSIILIIVPFGVVLGYARSRRTSIWVPVVLHMLNNLLTVLVP